MLSTPRKTAPKIDPTRRHLLTVAVGGAVVAALPTAVLAAASSADPIFAVIAEKLAADVVHCEAIDVVDEAERQYGYGSNPVPDPVEEAYQRSGDACHAVNEVDWKLARTVPTTLAGVIAVLRFANEIEDAGNQWPHTDTIGREGWHYQLQATMATAIEALAGTAMQS